MSLHPLPGPDTPPDNPPEPVPPPGDHDAPDETDSATIHALETPTPPPPSDPETAPDEPGDPDVTHNLTDLGNARRLVEAHGTDLRYVPQWGRWLHWDGRRWARDTTGHVARMAKAVVAAILTEAAAVDDPDDRKRIVSHSFRSEHRSRLEAMVALAQTEPGIPVEPHQLDADPWLLTVANGTLDLRSGDLRPHDPADLITKASPVHYNPDATSEAWDRFLETALGGDTELVAFLARAVGYSLTGDTREEVLFFVHGPAASGKSTFFGAIEAALGDWALHADFETFLSRQDAGGPRGDIARLAGARFVDSIEVDEGKKLAEGLIKTITGGDTVTAAYKYRDDFEFRPAFKLWLAANHAPRIRHGDQAMWRRILRVPFEHPVAKEDQDPTVKAALTDPGGAGPAILAWAVAGCLDWQHQGLEVPASVTRATDAYRAEMDPLGEFLEEHCRLDPDAWATAEHLRKRYGEWCEENDVKRSLSPKAFRDVLREHGCEPERKVIDGRRCRIWVGIGVLDQIEREQRDSKDSQDSTSEKLSYEGGNYKKSSEPLSRPSLLSTPTPPIQEPLTVAETTFEPPPDDDWIDEQELGEDPDEF